MNKKFRLLSLISILLFLSSCAEDLAIGAFDGLAEAGKKERRIKTAWSEVGYNQRDFDDFSSRLDRFTSCNKLIENNDFYKFFITKSPKLKNYKHYSDQTFVNQADKMSVAWYGIEVDKCFDHIRGINYGSLMAQEFAMIPKRRIIQILFALASLDNKEINWGQFNRKIDNINNQAKQKSEDFLIQLDNKSYQVSNRIMVLKEADAIRSHRTYLRQELEKSKNQISQLRGDAKKLQEEKRMLEIERRQLELCTENPGAYYDCP